MLHSTGLRLTLNYTEREQESSHVIILESAGVLLRRAWPQAYFVLVLFLKILECYERLSGGFHYYS